MQVTDIGSLVKCGAVLASPLEVAEALRLMGLTIGRLHTAIEAGEGDRDSCNEFNPPMDAGNRAHGTVVRVLRESLVADGWVPHNEQNFSTIVSPDGTIRIAVGSGDEATGNPLRSPYTKHRKGETLVGSVQRNQLQLFCQSRDKQATPVTWVLLRSRFDNILRSELSVGTSVANERVYFDGTRIILPERDLGSLRTSHDDAPSEIDVPVRRRLA